jgi:phenylacetaldehyde dehydrogenase
MATVEAPALNQAASSFVSKPRQLLIDGKWIDAADGKTFPVIDPATGETVAHVAEGGAKDIDAAVRAARKTFDAGVWPNTAPNERAKLLWKLADLIDQNAEELAQLETLDNGKPLTIAGIADIPGAAEQFRYMAGWATKIDGATLGLSAPGDYHAYTLREPIGVVGQIIPWNFPLLMAAWKIGPALATGCTVVLKPAEQTPLTAVRLGELICEAGFPDGAVNIVTGYGETAGAALSAHDMVDKVAFTGSTEVGKLIVKAATGNLKKVSLELGGKAPNIVFDDADVAAATMGAANAIFFNQGQVCCAGSRLYVEKDIFDDVVNGVAEGAKGIKVGNGFDPETLMGPLVSEEQFDRVTGYLEAGKAEGAEAICGGNRHGDQGYFVEPTVLVNTNPNMKVVREEIFGPVVVAQPFSDLDDLAAQANDTPYGLSAGIWTKDISKAHKLAKRIKAGTVWINCYNVFDQAMPFGGYKQSGWGRENGKEVLENYLQTKAVCCEL